MCFKKFGSITTWDTCRMGRERKGLKDEPRCQRMLETTRQRREAILGRHRFYEYTLSSVFAHGVRAWVGKRNHSFDVEHANRYRGHEASF